MIFYETGIAVKTMNDNSNLAIMNNFFEEKEEECLKAIIIMEKNNNENEIK